MISFFLGSSGGTICSPGCAVPAGAGHSLVPHLFMDQTFGVLTTAFTLRERHIGLNPAAVEITLC